MVVLAKDVLGMMSTQPVAVAAQIVLKGTARLIGIVALEQIGPASISIAISAEARVIGPATKPVVAHETFAIIVTPAIPTVAVVNASLVKSRPTGCSIITV